MWPGAIKNRRQRRENMNKSARCAPRLNAREAAENAEMLLIAAEQCAEILADLPKTKANEAYTVSALFFGTLDSEPKRTCDTAALPP